MPGSYFKDMMTAVTRQPLYRLCVVDASILINVLSTTSIHRVGGFLPTFFDTDERRWHDYSGVQSSPSKTEAPTSHSS